VAITSHENRGLINRPQFVFVVNRVDNEPNQFEYSSRFDSTINALNLVREPNELNLS